MVQTQIQNPILRGFNPDPTILKVEETYYIVVSSFEWLPGLRVYQSNDLVNWSHLTDILTEQVDLQGNPKDGSIWAPQLSYRDGLFYCIYSDVKNTTRPFKDVHNYLITAERMTGPWSEPIYLNSSGFDPSLFHDEDGRYWFLNEIWDYRVTTSNKSAGIVLQEYDPISQTLIGEVYKIFDGTALAKTEAPHLYKRNGYYYLITAEGGTGVNHSVTVCRAKNITGPYELDPNYPMLTASNLPDSPLQCTGHGSLVEGLNGKWYMAYLTTRPLQGKAILGRETAIQEVVWTSDGWLRLANGTTKPEAVTLIETTKKIEQQIDTTFHDDFSSNILNKEWNARRILPSSNWCDVTSRPGYLRLVSGESPQSSFENHLLAIRQKDFSFEATTQLEFMPRTFNQMAGLFLYLNESNYLYGYMTFDDDQGRVLRMMRCQNGEHTLFTTVVLLREQPLDLKIVVKETTGNYYWRQSQNEPWAKLGEEQDLLFLAGGFTGNFIGIGVQDLDLKEGIHADFAFFDYSPIHGSNKE